MPELETVSLEGVEILEADVTIHGVGSPPEGDRWSSDDLRAMATAAQELEAAGEWRIPTKIGAEPLGITKLGHNKEQMLLNTGELPAAGWLTNQRVSDDGKKLLADITDIPRKIADLIKAKAYRQRSSELGSVKSQKTGKSYPWVVTGLAHLGGKMPAVRTLDEVLALYEGDDAKRRFLQVDDVNDASIDELRDAIASVGADFAREFQESVSSERAPADIRRTMADAKKSYTDDQRRTFAEATGLELDKVTDEVLEKAGVPVAEEKPVAPVVAEPVVNLEADERLRTLEQRVEDGEKKRRDLETQLETERRDTWLESIFRDGKATPGQRDDIVAMYEEAPAATRKFYEAAPVNAGWALEYGADSDEILDDDALEEQNKSYEADAATRLGIPAGEVI